MGHALASTVVEFGFARFFLGLGESGNFPAALKTVAEWFPQSERSLATGIFNSGANVGAILAPAIVPWVTLRWGWHAAFLTTGFFSVLWILWWLRYYRKPTDHPTLTGEELRHIYQEAAEFNAGKSYASAKVENPTGRALGQPPNGARHNRRGNGGPIFITKKSRDCSSAPHRFNDFVESGIAFGRSAAA